MTLLFCGHAGAQGVRLFQQHCFSQEQVLALGCFGIQHKVHTTRYQLCHNQRRTVNKTAEIKPVQQILAHLKLFLKLRICNFRNIHIAIPGLVALGIFLHGSFEGRCNAHIVHDQAALFVLEHTVHTSNRLHQIITVHRLVDVHCRQRGNIKTGQPHIHHDSDLHWIIVIFELSRQFLLVRFCPNNRFPVLRVVVTAGHDHTDFLFPCRTQFQQLPVDFHGNRARIGNNHRLTGQQVGTVFFVVGDNILAQRLHRRICAQHAFHLSQHFLAFFNGRCVRLLLQCVISRINQSQRVLIQMQLDDAAFVVDRARCAILHRLRHVVNINAPPCQSRFFEPQADRARDSAPGGPPCSAETNLRNQLCCTGSCRPANPAGC